jgi:hypothetical protein
MAFWLVVFAIALLIVACLSSGRSETRFSERWPAIDDDEFVRRCPPGTDRNIALAVRRIVSTQLSIPYEHIHPEQNFVDDLNV